MVAPGDLGLTRLQLRSFVIDHIGREPGALAPDATQRLGDVAQVYAERHDRPITGLKATRVEYPPDGGPEREMILAQWP